MQIADPAGPYQDWTHEPVSPRGGLLTVVDDDQAAAVLTYTTIDPRAECGGWQFTVAPASRKAVTGAISGIPQGGSVGVESQIRWRLVPPDWWRNSPPDPDSTATGQALAGFPFADPPTFSSGDGEAAVRWPIGGSGWRWPRNDPGDWATQRRTGVPAEYSWGVWSDWSDEPAARDHWDQVHGPDPDPHDIAFSGWTVETEGRARARQSGAGGWSPWSEWVHSAELTAACPDVSDKQRLRPVA